MCAHPRHLSHHQRLMDRSLCHSNLLANPGLSRRAFLVYVLVSLFDFMTI
ncbi:hypothetical protein DSUL_60036 [Desulfovibrionales bacterium]